MDIQNPLDSISKSTLFKSALIISVIWLVIGVSLEGYEITKSQNEVLCLGCLALDPVVDEFEGFWVEHPEDDKIPKHPGWVKDELGKKKVVFIFLWDDGCTPCDEQWDDMKDAGLVKGSEDDGEMAKYTGNVTLFSLKASDNDRGSEARDIYDPNGGGHGTPNSIFLTKEGNSETTIYWWAGEGKMKASDVDEVINAGLDK